MRGIWKSEISSMKLFDTLRSILEMCCWFPRISVDRIVLPTDQIKESFAIAFGIEDLVDFLFRFALGDENRRRWKSSNTIRDN
jgi:hypothetical protein